MTLDIFPNLDGIDLEWSVRPEFKTSVFKALSGVESRIMLRQYPLVTFKLSLEFLIENRDEQQLTELLGFMIARNGMYGAFLYSSPHDNFVLDGSIGYGDGIKKIFYLQRKYGEKYEIIQNINGTAIIYVDNVVVAASISGDGIATLAVAPPVGSRVSWTGKYYYKVRFGDDSYDFSRLVNGVYECRDIQLVGSLRNLV